MSTIFGMFCAAHASTVSWGDVLMSLATCRFALRCASSRSRTLSSSRISVDVNTLSLKPSLTQLMVVLARRHALATNRQGARNWSPQPLVVCPNSSRTSSFFRSWMTQSHALTMLTWGVENSFWARDAVVHSQRVDGCLALSLATSSGVVGCSSSVSFVSRSASTVVSATTAHITVRYFVMVRDLPRKMSDDSCAEYRASESSLLRLATSSSKSLGIRNR